MNLLQICNARGNMSFSKHLGFCLLLGLVILPCCRVYCSDAGNETVVIGPHHNTPTTHATVDSDHHNDMNKDNHSDHDGSHGNNTQHHGNHSESHGGHGIHVASWNFQYVKEPILITMFLIVTAICKLGFHHSGFLSAIVPESCLLIILGTIVGAIVHSSGHAQDFVTEMDPRTFFLFLLPPIILESAYSLHDRVFFENLGTVLLYAVAGTLLNCFLLGPALYGLAQAGAMGVIQIKLIQCLVFSSLIVAVDPVAVLAIFQEIGVNNVLYFLVFGESLLNDAVTVVLYNMMVAFNEMGEIPGSQIGLGFAAFFSVSLGGLSIGIVFGMLTGLVTRFTETVRVVEPLAVFAFAYGSYLTAELFHFSGIISIIGCGLVQAQYSFHNISHKSLTTVTYFSKMLSTTCDCIIFMFLGLALVRENHVWHTGFILWVIFLCLLIRFIGVFFLTFLANHLDRVRTIDLQEQFIMAYGGLRGAVAFSLVSMLKEETNPHKNLFQTATLAVIISTVFIQGITIKPLVKLLNISMQENKLSLYEEINYNVADHIMAGIEEIIGHFGRNVVREAINRFDDQYLKHILQRNPQRKDDHIMELYHKIALRQHYDNLGGKVADEKYASSVALYKPELGEHGGHEDDTFHQMAQNPELIDQTLDNHIRRRRAVSSAGVLSTGEETYTKDDIRKMLVKNTGRGMMHQKYDPNLKEGSSNDLVHLLHEKQMRAQRLKQVRHRFSDSPFSSCYSSPNGSIRGHPHPEVLGSIPEVNSSGHLRDGMVNSHPAGEVTRRPHHHAHHKHPATYHGSVHTGKHRKKRGHLDMGSHHHEDHRDEKVHEKVTSFDGSSPTPTVKDETQGSRKQIIDNGNAKKPKNEKEPEQSKPSDNKSNHSLRDSPDGSSSKQNSQEKPTDSVEIPTIRSNIEQVSVGLGGVTNTESLPNETQRDSVALNIVIGDEEYPPHDTTMM